MKKYFIFFVVVLSVSTASIFIFYFGRPRSPKTEEVEHPLRNPKPADELVITYSNPGRTKEILRTVVLNKLIVEDSSLDVIEVFGEKKPLLNLKTSFTYRGRERKLIIPIVDAISFRKKVDEDFEDEGEKSVAILNFEKGSIVNVALSYVPIDVAVEKEVVADFCNARVYEVCLRYLKLGFGDIPTDFSEYLDQLLDNSLKVDYKVAFPTLISLLEN